MRVKLKMRVGRLWDDCGATVLRHRARTYVHVRPKYFLLRPTAISVAPGPALNIANILSRFPLTSASYNNYA